MIEEQNTDVTAAPVQPTRKRGFGGMSMEKRRMISAMGGRAVKPENRAFSKDKDLARTAGRRGGSRIKSRTADREAASVDTVS